MKILISLYAWIVGLLSIGSMLIIGIIISYILPNKVVDRFVKFGCRFSLRLMCIRVRTEGEHNVEPGKAYLFMSNHVNLFDAPILEGHIPTYMRAIEADRQFKWPIYGWAIRRFGNIPISRTSVHASIRSMKIAQERLLSGQSILVLPEGHRTLDGQMRPFKKLPFHLAKEADVEIIPVGMSGLFYIKQKPSWLIRPSKVKLKFGPPISRETIRKLSVMELRDHVQEKVAVLIERP